VVAVDPLPENVIRIHCIRKFIRQKGDIGKSDILANGV